MNLFDNLQWLIGPIWKSIRNQCSSNLKYIELDIKRGHLMSSDLKDKQYQQYVQQSQEDDFVILNTMPEGRKYKVHAGVEDKGWYDNFLENCQKSKCLRNRDQEVLIEVRYQKQRAWKVMGEYQWHGRSRMQKLNKQFNVLVLGNEYRVGLNLEVPMQQKQNAVDRLANNMNDEGARQRFVEEMNCIRIKQNKSFHFSECYTVITSRVVQLDSQAEKEEFMKVCLLKDGKQIDEYIKQKLSKSKALASIPQKKQYLTSNQNNFAANTQQQKSQQKLPSQSTLLPRYQITLKHKITPQIASIFQNPHTLNTYLGLVMLNFNSLRFKLFDYQWEKQVFEAFKRQEQEMRQMWDNYDEDEKFMTQKIGKVDEKQKNQQEKQ